MTSIFRFLSPAQKRDVENRTFTLDVSPQIQQAIDSVSAGEDDDPMLRLEFPMGGYRLDSSLSITLPIRLIGAGCGTEINADPAPTELCWYGGADRMIYFGTAEPQQTIISGGGIEDMRLDGMQRATCVLYIIDCLHSSFRRIAPMNATQQVMAIMTTPTKSPSGLMMFENIWATTGFTGSNMADCLLVSSTVVPHPAGVDGVYSCTFISCNFGADQGNGVHVVDRGDNFLWLRCSTGHRNPDSHGTLFDGSEDGSVVSDHVWVNHTGDFWFGKGLGIGQRIIDLNMADLSAPKFSDPRVMVAGPGATEVTIDSNIGFMWGQNKTLGYRETIHHDAMQFMGYDALNQLLHTSHGMWKVMRSGIGGSVSDAHTAGGAVTLTTGAMRNNWIALCNAATVGDGNRIDQYPNTVFSVCPNSLTGLKIRCGWVDSTTDPPANGVYVEVDTTVPWEGWRFVTVSNGAVTSVNSAYAFNLGGVIYQFRIELAANPPAASFYCRDYAFQVWEHKTILAGLPASDKPMSFVFQIMTLDNNPKSIAVNDFKLGFNTEE